MSNDNALNSLKNLLEKEKKSFTDDEVMELCEELGKTLARKKRRDEKKENTNTQVRKFYNLIGVVKTKKSDEKIKISLRTFQAQVAYAIARKTINEDFKEFFDVSFKKVLGSPEITKTLDQFTKFFEAVYAYFYYYLEMGTQNAAPNKGQGNRQGNWGRGERRP
jgi:CRISPR type III-A-associated protein Csm2